MSVYLLNLPCIGASGQTRTGTSAKTADFESAASTNSATEAKTLTYKVARYLYEIFAQL